MKKPKLLWELGEGCPTDEIFLVSSNVGTRQILFKANVVQGKCS